MALSTYEVKYNALAICIRTKRPVCLWGDPGIGKTSSIYKLGEQLPTDHHVKDSTLVGSYLEPSDLYGLPMKGDNDTVVYGTFDWARNLTDNDILFLDEFTTCPPAIQAGFMRVTLERKVGWYSLPNCAIVLAANHPDDVSGTDMLLPMRNRVTHIDWVPDDHYFMRKASSNYILPPQLAEGWKDRISYYEALVDGFLRRKPDLRNKKPQVGTATDDTQQAWPSSRSWEATAMLMAASEHLDIQVQETLVAGTVGNGAAIEFLTYIGEVDLPDPELLIAQPDRFKMPERADIQFAVLQSVIAAIGRDCTEIRYKAGWDIISRAAKRAIDIAAVGGKELMAVGKEHRMKFMPNLEVFQHLVNVIGGTK